MLNFCVPVLCPFCSVRVGWSTTHFVLHLENRLRMGWLCCMVLSGSLILMHFVYVWLKE